MRGDYTSESILYKRIFTRGALYLIPTNPILTRNKTQTLQMTLQGAENLESQQYATMRVASVARCPSYKVTELQSYKSYQLQTKLVNLECTAGLTVTASRQPEECHLSATEFYLRELFRDVTNFSVQHAMPQLISTPACAHCQVKSAADVIGANSKLLLSVTKAAEKDKFKDIKAKTS